MAKRLTEIEKQDAIDALQNALDAARCTRDAIWCDVERASRTLNGANYLKLMSEWRAACELARDAKCRLDRKLAQFGR